MGYRRQKNKTMTISLIVYYIFTYIIIGSVISAISLAVIKQQETYIDMDDYVICLVLGITWPYLITYLIISGFIFLYNKIIRSN